MGSLTAETESMEMMNFPLRHEMQWQNHYQIMMRYKCLGTITAHKCKYSKRHDKKDFQILNKESFTSNAKHIKFPL